MVIKNQMDEIEKPNFSFKEIEAMQIIPLLLLMGKRFDEIIGELEKHMAKISQWFFHNYLKANAKKFHLFLRTFFEKRINIENFTIKSIYTEVLCI